MYRWYLLPTSYKPWALLDLDLDLDRDWLCILDGLDVDDDDLLDEELIQVDLGGLCCIISNTSFLKMSISALRASMSLLDWLDGTLFSLFCRSNLFSFCKTTFLFLSIDMFSSRRVLLFSLSTSCVLNVLYCSLKSVFIFWKFSTMLASFNSMVWISSWSFLISSACCIFIVSTISSSDLMVWLRCSQFWQIELSVCDAMLVNSFEGVRFCANKGAELTAVVTFDCLLLNHGTPWASRCSIRIGMSL